MTSKVVITVEKFDNGISLKWVGSEEGSAISKSVATNGNEALSIGREVWDDIMFIMDKSSADAVRITLEYESLDV